MCYCVFFLNRSVPAQYSQYVHTLSLHDACPILRGIINSTWKRGRYVSRANGRRFSTWTPVAIALNGHLHPFTESRAIIIKLARKSKDETVARPKERSEEHTSELQLLMRTSYAAFRVTKQTTKTQTTEHTV